MFETERKENDSSRKTRMTSGDDCDDAPRALTFSLSRFLSLSVCVCVCVCVCVAGALL